jgi:hypothetical protein
MATKYALKRFVGDDWQASDGFQGRARDPESWGSGRLKVPICRVFRLVAIQVILPQLWSMCGVRFAT